MIRRKFELREGHEAGYLPRLPHLWGSSADLHQAGVWICAVLAHGGLHARVGAGTGDTD